MVRHQTICVHLAAEFPGQLAKVMEVKNAIAVRLKANAAIDAALDNVGSHIGEEQAKLSGHERATPLDTPRLTDPGLTRIYAPKIGV